MITTKHSQKHLNIYIIKLHNLDIFFLIDGIEIVNESEKTSRKEVGKCQIPMKRVLKKGMCETTFFLKT